MMRVCVVVVPAFAGREGAGKCEICCGLLGYALRARGCLQFGR